MVKCVVLRIYFLLGKSPPWTDVFPLLAQSARGQLSAFGELRLWHGETFVGQDAPLRNATLAHDPPVPSCAAPALFRVEPLAGKRSRNRSARDASAKQNTTERRKPPVPAKTGRKPQGRTNKRAAARFKRRPRVSLFITKRVACITRYTEAHASA